MVKVSFFVIENLCWDYSYLLTHQTLMDASYAIDSVKMNPPSEILVLHGVLGTRCQGQLS